MIQCATYLLYNNNLFCYNLKLTKIILFLFKSLKNTPDVFCGVYKNQNYLITQMSLYMLLRRRLSPKEIQSFFKSVTQLTVEFYAEKRLDKIEKYMRQYKKKYTCFIYRKFRFHLFGSPCHAFFRSYFFPFYFFPLQIFTYIFLLN